MTAAVLGVGLILDELTVWDWRFRLTMIGACCVVALFVGALAWLVAAQVRRWRRPR